MKLGLFGDSFGYQKTGQSFDSWVDLLSQHADIDNRCQCGVSEYKILQQIKAAKLDDYDQIIITHTSPTRVFVRDNPIHIDSSTHGQCDILLADVEARNDMFSNACKNYFKYIFDIEYATDIHNLICKEIDSLVKNHNVVHITHFDYSECYQFVNMINFYNLWLDNCGPVNHYNEYGNREIYNVLFEKLKHVNN